MDNVPALLIENFYYTCKLLSFGGLLASGRFFFLKAKSFYKMGIDFRRFPNPLEKNVYSQSIL